MFHWNDYLINRMTQVQDNADVLPEACLRVCVSLGRLPSPVIVLSFISSGLFSQAGRERAHFLSLCSFLFFFLLRRR